MELILQVCQHLGHRLPIFWDIWGSILEDILYAIITLPPFSKVDPRHILYHYYVRPSGQGDMDLTYVAV